MSKIVAGILAHVDAGKTTLSESLLVNAGVLRKAGRVDTKDCFLDNNEMERERGITIFSKLARMSFGKNEFVLVDTPGHVDFGAEMERTLNVLDIAILLISASDGVQAHTKTVWKLLSSRKIPVFIFVNKMDLPDTDKVKILNNLKTELSGNIVDFSKGCGENICEDVATCSDKLLDLYMENGKIDDSDISEAIRERILFPVFFGSALKDISVHEFMEDLDRFAPAPSYGNEFGAVAYKIARDKAGNRLTYLKITGGILKVKDLCNGEKVNDIRLYSGEKYESVPEAGPGEICAVTGLKESKAGTGYGTERGFNGSTLEPVITYAIGYPDDIDATQMLKMLSELEEEEPNLSVEYNEATREIYVHLMGEVQTEILTRLLRDRFNVSVSFGVGRILYKETISDVVEGVGHFEPLRHYAEVHLKLEPLECGAGLEFASEVSVDDLSLNWQRLVLTHLKEREHRGVLTGSPITDMKITLVAGRAHQKHTEGGDFRQATYRAIRQGLMQAESVLLEPFYYYELTIPDNAVGKAMTDIDRMWGNATVSEQMNGMTTLTGTAPVSTLNGYASEVVAYTKGLGTLSVSLAGYEPCHNTEEVLRDRHYDPERDLKNPCDSVFCSHGAGTVIPWYEVPDYMHLPFVIYSDFEAESEKETIRDMRPTESAVFVTTEEIDEIINRTAYANRNGRKGSYKGIPEKLREKRRAGGRREEVQPSYRGTEQKPKFMLIDGYNVVHAWNELSDLADRDINAAAGRLIDIVSNYRGMSDYDIILVFDAYKVPGHKTEEMDYGNIKVVYTKTAETADHYIERYAHENGRKYDVIVVTSDGVEQVIIRGEGCRLMSSRDFEKEIERAMEDLRSHYNFDSV